MRAACFGLLFRLLTATKDTSKKHIPSSALPKNSLTGVVYVSAYKLMHYVQVCYLTACAQQSKRLSIPKCFHKLNAILYSKIGLESGCSPVHAPEPLPDYS